ncbi:hypothetical protein AB0M39_25250 [Streptomyces sp. NPDC051907]|uniref:hypothetical protein n=1 Tax=Streptomyces sp. NPDC051907 TaxID=3155284 RepID=UPI00343E1B17
MVLTIPQALYDMAVGFMKDAGLSPKAAAEKAKAAVPGASKADEWDVLRKLEDAKLAGTITLTHKNSGSRLALMSGGALEARQPDAYEDEDRWQAVRVADGDIHLKHAKSGKLLASRQMIGPAGRHDLYAHADDEDSKYTDDVRWLVDWSSDALMLRSQSSGALLAMDAEPCAEPDRSGGDVDGKEWLVATV